MKIAILGFGLEGKSLLKFLKKSPQFRNADIWILDSNPKIIQCGGIGCPDIKKILGTSDVKNIKFQTGKNYLKNLERFDIVFRSPGAPYNLPEIQRAIKKGVEFSSATKLFFEEIKKMVRRGSPQVIGVTGTKGKGTTSALLYKILKACGKNTYLAGNIGKPAIEILPKLKKNSIIVLELSSFQLQDLNQSPDITVVLDIFPDHLDAHKNFHEYINAKANITKWQKKNDKIFYFSDNKYSRQIAEKSKGRKIPVQFQYKEVGLPNIPNKPSIFRKSDFQKLKRDIKIPGFHNFKNAIMAANIALSLGCPKNKILNTIKNFKGTEHRLEFIKKIKEISFYNDSASTNPQTAAAAIKSFSEPKILIAGGKDKNLNYSPLAKALKNSNTKLVILYGENKSKIKRQIANSKAQIALVKNLKSAVELAYQKAKSYKLKAKSCIVIFSPASTSFDMFKDYKDRGKKFKEIVKKI